MVVGSKDYQIAQALGLLSGSDGIVVSNTGSGSNNQATISNTNQSWFDLTNLVNVINTLQSAATSGGAQATSNTQVGSAVTGAASVLANIINLLASAWSWSNGSLGVFMQNIFGSQTGDIHLVPSQTATGGGGQIGGVSANVSGTGSGSTNVAGVNNSSSLDVNAKSTGNIVNNVDVNAQSGNASAAGNTVAGYVASGNALAEVNIFNLINSYISAGSSFFGILNIFGSLNGDILFPDGFLNGLLGSGGSGESGSAAISGTGAGSSNQAGIANNAQTKVNNTLSNSVANNIQTTAASGAVNATANTTAGNLQTGSANTTQGLFNISNTSLFGDNAVLVIVNVLGHWVGKIMNLPNGSATESALLTGTASVGINGTGSGSANQAQVNNAASANVNQQSTGTITNNVNVNAQSGNADATNNTKVGDIASGSAKAATSVANIFNTVVNVKHWFGVLIINVFGDWLGDVNHDSAAGTLGAGSGGQSNAAATEAQSAALSLGVAAGVGSQATATAGAGSAGPAVTGAGSGGSSHDAQVLTAGVSRAAADKTAAAAGNDMSGLFGISAIVLLLAGALASAERRLRKLG
jgi:hypothetical protein